MICFILFFLSLVGAPQLYSKEPISCKQTTTAHYPKTVLPSSGEELSLVQLLDIALNNNPLTRESWAEARIAAALLGQARSELYPTIDFTAKMNHTRLVQPPHTPHIPYSENIYSAELSLNYLILDFGERHCNIVSAEDSLRAAEWNYDWTIQTVLLSVIQSYYNYVTAIEVLKIFEVNLEDAKTSEAAAKAMFEAGVTSKIDVFQAQTNRVQVEINVETQKSVVKTTHAALANAMGIPILTCFNTTPLLEPFAPREICLAIDKLIEDAKGSRADLAALRATVRARQAALCAQKAALLPTLSTASQVGRTNVRPLYDDQIDFQLALILDVPIFTGFNQENIIRQAQAELNASQANLRVQELQAFLDLYTSYYSIKTAAEQLYYTEKYVKYATESYNATFESYKYGTTSLIDVLVTQDTLHSARLERIQAEASWFISLAQFSYNLGSISFYYSENSTYNPIKKPWPCSTSRGYDSLKMEKKCH